MVVQPRLSQLSIMCKFILSRMSMLHYINHVSLRQINTLIYKYMYIYIYIYIYIYTYTHLYDEIQTLENILTYLRGVALQP